MDKQQTNATIIPTTAMVLMMIWSQLLFLDGKVYFFLQTGRYLEHGAVCLKWGEPYSCTVLVQHSRNGSPAEWARMMSWSLSFKAGLFVNIYKSQVSTSALLTVTWNYTDVVVIFQL